MLYECMILLQIVWFEKCKSSEEGRTGIGLVVVPRFLVSMHGSTHRQCAGVVMVGPGISPPWEGLEREREQIVCP